MEMHYKDFELRVTTKQLVDSGEWTTCVMIQFHTSERALSEYCTSSNTFPDRSDAEMHCIQFGKRVGDEQYPYLTTTDLL